MKKNHYIDNKKFEELIKNHIADPENWDDDLVEMLDLLISNIIDSFGFDVDKDDAKQECFLLVIKTLKNFTPNKGSAFNYFTTVIINNLKLMYTKNKRYRAKINHYIEYKLGKPTDRSFTRLDDDKYGKDNPEK